MILKNILLMFTYILLLSFLGIQTIEHSTEVMESVRLGFDLWKNSIVPSLFPFFILSDFLIYFNFVEIISEFFRPFMQKFFRMRGVNAFILTMSMLSGCPSNAKYTQTLLEQNQITEKEATKVLRFSHFSSPLFIFGTVATIFLDQPKVGIFILLLHYLGNFFIGFIFRKDVVPLNQEKTSRKEVFFNLAKKKKEKFGIFFTRIIQKNVQTLLTILGTITTFLVFTTLLNQVFQFPPILHSIFQGILEMTQGLKSIGLLSISLKWKVTLSIFILSFGGLSVHMQMFSILNEKVKYTPFLFSRILHAFFSSILSYLLFDFFY